MKNEFEDLLSKKEHIIGLYDIYKGLLTEKQKDYFESYYYEDMSLAEISSVNNVSRNAVFSALKQIENVLNNYEENLLLKKKLDCLQNIIFEYEDNSNEDVKNIINTIKGME
jgi:predicted DNA-binding protein YlxM (UPF0122 family)